MANILAGRRRAVSAAPHALGRTLTTTLNHTRPHPRPGSHLKIVLLVNIDQRTSEWIEKLTPLASGVPARCRAPPDPKRRAHV
jgi:hypothetical protein